MCDLEQSKNYFKSFGPVCIQFKTHPFKNSITVNLVHPGKYIIGHDLRNDFAALKIKVDPTLVRDTSGCVALRYLAGLPSNKKPSLRNLTGITIQLV